MSTECVIADMTLRSLPQQNIIEVANLTAGESGFPNPKPVADFLKLIGEKNLR